MQTLDYSLECFGGADDDDDEEGQDKTKILIRVICSDSVFFNFSMTA